MHALRTRVGAGVFVATLTMLCACEAPKDEWTEEVQVADGEIALVHTRIASEVRSPIGDAAQRFTRGATLKILNQNPDAPEWVDDRDPIMLLRDPETKDFVLVASSGDSRVWERHGRPMNPYWMFRLRRGAWNEESMSEFVFGRDTNLVLTLGLAAQKKGIVTISDKILWRDKSNAIRSYRRIEKHYEVGRD
jgi:hypothetical protein